MCMLKFVLPFTLYIFQWSCTNYRRGHKGEAGVDLVVFNDNADSFKKKAKGLLSLAVCDHITRESPDIQRGSRVFGDLL